LPPHPDVREGLERLRGAGVRLVTLTNSTEQVGQAQITNAGLSEYLVGDMAGTYVIGLKE
jgi:2-haloacid dehalogenase